MLRSTADSAEKEGDDANMTAELDLVLGAVDDRSPRAIAGAISRLVTGAQLLPGDRLPTVRELARRLGISPTTVSEAWQVLSHLGVIESRGRAGSFVLGSPRPLAPRRYRRITDIPAHLDLDLSTGTPDPDLLPDFRPLLTKVSRQDLTQSYLDDPVLPALDETLRQRWPFVPEALTVVDGAMDALDRVCTHLVRFGDRVAVENPGFPPLLDLLEQLGAEVIALDLDRHGVTPASMQAALHAAPVAVFMQPRAHNPAGVSINASRAKQLAALINGRGVIVVEDDHSGDIASSPLESLGRHIPGQCVLIQSFSKSHGPDLRIAAVGGTEAVVTPLVNRRTLGPGWTSRVLQSLLARMLDDARVMATVEYAREAYAARRALMVDALHGRGVRTTGTDGINLWIEARDEQAALLTLAAQGIGAAPGAPFITEPFPSDHLRVTVGLVRGEHEALADRLADAVLGVGRRTTRPRARTS